MQNILPSTTHVIAAIIDVRAKNILKQVNRNILHPKWLYDCIKYNKIMELSPIYLVYTNSDTISSFKVSMDKYNDHYFLHTNAGYLEEILGRMKKPSNILSIEEIKQFFKEEFQDEVNFFNNFK